MYRNSVLISLVSLFLISLPLWSEPGPDPGGVAIDPSRVDLSRVDMAEAELCFQGPMELYISGIEYGGNSYAAVLEFDGEDTVKVRVPERISDKGKPKTVDLKGILFALEDGMVKVDGVSVDGSSYSGSFRYDAENEAFRLSELHRVDASEAESSETMETIVKSLREVIDQQERRISELEYTIEQKDTTILELTMAQRKEETKAQEELDIVKSRLSSPIISGFDSDTSLLSGEWKAQNGRLMQTDAGSYSAKYGIRFLQSKNEYLYTFRGTTAEESWVGFGLHFLASGTDNADKYTFGDSYLVWITRDYRHNRSEKTFVELYKSYTDDNMVRLVSKAIYQDAAEMPRVSVHTDAANKRISVYVGNKRVFDFEDRSMFREGDFTALRALGEATFSEFTVYGK